MTIELAPHQQRVVDEKAELDGRIARLAAFFETDVFADLPLEERVRLQRQLRVQQALSHILGERIAAFRGNPYHPDVASVDAWRRIAEEVAVTANAFGVIVTVEQRSPAPFAMGHLETVVGARQDRTGNHRVVNPLHAEALAAARR